MAIKDRITKKTTKPAAAAAKRKTKIRSGIDVLDFFEMNKSISGLFIYDSNNIYVETDGLTQRTDEVFDISLSDLIRVIVSKYENNFISVGDSYVIVTENGTQINIVSRPYLQSGSFITFKKKRTYEYSMEYLLKRQVLNYDISDYLRQKIKNGENIFVVGASYTDKLPVLSHLSGLVDENVAIVQGLDDISTDVPNHLVFSKHTLPFKEVVSKAFELNHSLVVTECSDISELMSVFEFINAGFKHFIAAFNINSKEDFIENLKNSIMLNYPQMSESKIVGLIMSAVKNVVFLEKMPDGETRISHVCTLKSEENAIRLEDLFVFDFGSYKFAATESGDKKAKKKSEPKKARKVVIRRKKQQPQEINNEAESKEETQPEIQSAEVIQPKEEIQPEVQSIEIIQPKEEIQPEIQPIEETKEEIAEIVPEQVVTEPVIETEIIIPPEIQEVEVPIKVNKYKLLKEKIKQRREQI